MSFFGPSASGGGNSAEGKRHISFRSNEAKERIHRNCCRHNLGCPVHCMSLSRLIHAVSCTTISCARYRTTEYGSVVSYITVTYVMDTIRLLFANDLIDPSNRKDRCHL